ncbi:MAG: YbaB/EbfC family nucleoid-associated protein [Actinomycetota bacterium]|nr:YbaB/EbfC family nucleoid-associated protein [Actinomycetota bacterium]
MQPGGQPDMQQILQQAQKMQEQLMTAQAQLAEAEAVGQAGGGLVSVTLTGAGQLKNVRIDSKVVDPEDVDTLQDLIFGAFDDAQQKVQQLTQDTMGPLAGGLGGGGGLGLPGL